MAKFIVIRVGNDDDADTLMSNLNGEFWGDMGVVGVYKAPTLYCECSASDTGNKRASAFSYTRGQKYGWWVHKQCGKPSKPWASSHQAVISQAVNLLEVEKREEGDPGPLSYSDGLRLRAGVQDTRSLAERTPQSGDLLSSLSTVTPEAAIQTIQENGVS